MAIIHSFTEIAAAADAVPKRLWPQPWPAPPMATAFWVGDASCDSPGSASNSPMMPITGLPLPYSAMNAVGSPATPRLTVNPACSSSPARSALLFVSW